MATIQRETLAPLHEKIVVQVEEQDYMPAFEKTLKEYRRKAQIPGFRKGMVPASLIRKMYGQALFTEEVIRTAEQQLNRYLEEEKLDIFSQPLWLENEAPQLDLNAPGNYAFAFEIGLRPQFELKLLQPATELQQYVVQVTDQMVDDEMEYLLRRYAARERIEKFEQEDDFVQASFEQVDEQGEVMPDGRKQQLSFLFREIDEAHRAAWAGKQEKESVTAALHEIFSGDSLSYIMNRLGLDQNDPSAASTRFRITLEEIGRLKKPALEAEFFNRVFPEENIQTPEQFRQRVREEVEYYYQEIARERLRNELMEKLIHETEIPLPEAFLRHLIARNQSQPAESVDDQTLHAFLHQLRWTLIAQKLEQQSGVELTQEDILQKANADFIQYFDVYSQKHTPEYINRFTLQLLQNEKTFDKYATEAKNQKLLDWALQQVTIKEVPVSLDEFKAMLEKPSSHHTHQHSHEHEHEHA